MRADSGHGTRSGRRPPAASPWLVGVVVLGASAGADAANFAWPGPAPCNGTLQACIDGVGTDDRIRIGSEGPIDQDLNIARSLRLEALPGYRPRLSAGRRITAAGNGAQALDLRLRGFVLDSGNVEITRNGAGATTLSLQDLEINTAPGREGLRITTGGSGALNLTVENLAIAVDGMAGTDPRAALRLAHGSSGLLDGVIGFVRVGATGLGAAATIRIDTGSSSASLDLFGLRIDGHDFDAGIVVAASGGTLALNLVGNVVTGQRVIAPGAGGAALRVDAGASAATLNVLNNTLVDNARGLLLGLRGDLGGTLAGAVQNNLVAFHSVRGMDLPAATVGNRNNLVHANADDAWVPGVATLTTDPQLTDLAAARPGASSPAIGAGTRTLLDAVSAARALPALDVDGLRRYKGSGGVPDIGAYEWGDALVGHVVTAGNRAGNASAVSNALLDGLSAQAPQLGTRREAAVVHGGVVALRYTGSLAGPLPAERWSVIDEGLGGPELPLGAGFDLFVPDRAGSGVATVRPVQRIGAAAVLDLPGLNGDPIAFMLATHHRNGAGSPEVANPHPLGVEYDAASARWRVLNLDGAPMPADIAFNVYWQPESGSAFMHEAAAPNLVGSATLLSHAQLDGNPCARVLAQAHRIGGLAVAVPVATAYDTGSARWRIETLDGSPLPAGATFNVLVVPAQAETCAGALFDDGFE